MDETLAENFLLIDGTFSAGSTINVNSGLVANPNFNSVTPAAPGGSANVTFQTDINGNVSAYYTAGGGGAVTSVFGRVGAVVAAIGDYSYAQISGTPQLPITKAAVASNWLNSYTASTGVFTATQPAASDLSNGTTGTGAVVLASAISGFGTGTVTSVSSGNIDAIATVSVATATTTPAISFTLATQTANTVWAGPTTGAAAAPTFRALVTADLPAGTGTVLSVSGTANQIVATGSANVTLSIANPFTFPGPASMGTNYISETRVVGAAGTTAGLLVKINAAGAVVTAALGDVGTIGIAVTTQTSGQNVEVARIGLVQAVADNTITIGHIMVVGTVTAGRVSDSGQTSSLLVSNQVNIVGKALTAAVAGGTFTLQVYGPGFYGVTIPSGTVTWDQIGSAAANLTLANAAFTTTFQQTAATLWTWDNTTVATVATTNSSPAIVKSARYWTGAASAVDSWTLGSSLVAGANGASTLAFTHAGSTGVAKVTAPIFAATAAGTAAVPALQTSVAGYGFYSGAGGRVSFSANGTSIYEMRGTGINFGSGMEIGWSSAVGPDNTASDTGLSRTGAGVVGIGTGATGSVAGNLSLNRVNIAGVDHAGTATITAAATTVTVTYAANYTGAAAPVVVVTPTSDPLALGVPVGYWVTATGVTTAWTGFVVNIQTALSGNIIFNYVVFGKA
jgi:hypothetical protein